MPTITASQVKELRDRTGAGMMDCKKALGETEGDVEKAVELLRVRLGDKALSPAGAGPPGGPAQATTHPNPKAGGRAGAAATTAFWAPNRGLGASARGAPCTTP